MQTNSLATPLEWKSRLENYFADHGPSLLSALFILIVGIFVARWLGRAARRWLGRPELQLEPPIQMLGTRLVRLLVFIFALLIAADTAGIHVTAVLTGLGVIGVGVGLAMQSVLGNLIAGLNLIFTRPFRVGEYVELLGVQGRVQTIELFSTTLLSGDRSEIIIPNHKIVGEILRNYGQVRQLSLNVGVAYGADLNVVLATVRGVLERNPRVLKDPAPGVGINLLADSSINVTISPWTTVADYGAAQTEIYQAVVESFRAKNINIPFPQREVRLLEKIDHATE
jgi:small conductance mechanosensitive channel